ncbi:hypothetical protein LRS05_08010 [Flavobacterium sp. J372]|uniref:hypothetical protein n=1 Tax=Flavobacterium sp. J372 TaxID=2898436 RepID=UPI002150A480|nr:hypothetical protein [Flavobacterium sp. J372]MCR5862091.1 hypothetical protein [Flavobacterium sp. J372]
MKKYFRSCALLFLLISLHASAQVKQQPVERVNQMPDLPKPFGIINYNQLAKDFDATVYNFNSKGKNWPLVWVDKSQKNFPQDVVGIYTAMGDVRQGTANKGMFHEALATMGATLGATLVGVDKTKQDGRNYVAMLKNYFNKDTGWNIMMNNTAPEVALLGGGYGRDWWYDVYPNLLFYAIYDKYPNEPGLDSLARTIANKFYEADKILKGNYDYSYFDYGKMTPMKNNICIQPDAAAGHAWVLYSAYKKFGDEKYLQGALSALSALEANSQNPTYELLMPFGAYLAARISAEQGKKYDTAKMLRWSFDGTAICREGWGVLVGNWNGFDISGTVGSTVDHGGYGFLMNTYDAAWPLVPMVRYDQSYANAIGKWMLNAANASKFFYPQHMPDEHETIPQIANEVSKGVIAYEGIIERSNMDTYKHVKAPVAQGDGPLWVPGKNPPESQLSVYGSGHVGIFGSIIKTTDIEGILQLDLLATDFFRDKAYPTFLYYNPHNDGKAISINVGKKKIDLYDTVSGKYIARNVSGNTKINIGGKHSAVVVMVPAKGKVSYKGSKMTVNGVVVDYNAQGK